LTCSIEERYSESSLDLETCKQTAEELGYNFIYFQPLSERPQGVWCHIYKSCEKTRIPSLGGRNYELSVPTVKSESWDRQLTVTFINAASTPVNVIWIDYKGKEKVYKYNLTMGDEYKINTYFTHPWILKNSTDGRTALLAKFNDHTGPIFEAGDFEVDLRNNTPRIAIIDDCRLKEGYYENLQYEENAGKNDWHYVTITRKVDGDYTWENRAGKVWTLYSSEDVCAPLDVGEDCPYYDWPKPEYYRSASYNKAGIYGPGSGFYTFVGAPRYT